MNLTHSQNTCSMTELCGLYADGAAEFESGLKALLEQAKTAKRKMVIANLNPEQHANYGPSLTDAGFVCIGEYYGNSDNYVHTWVYGLRKQPAPAPKPSLLRLRIKKAISR